MNKYYIRFNPGHITNPAQLRPWAVIEVTNNSHRRIFLNSVNIQVPSWTEESNEDNKFWNVACIGILEVKDFHGVISGADLK